MSGGSTVRVATVAAHFRREIAFGLRRVSGIVDDAHRSGTDLLVLPHGALGGYHDHLDGEPTRPELPPTVSLDGPEIALLATEAGRMVVCLGVTEATAGGGRANTAVCLHDGVVLGVHRKVHLPAGEVGFYEPGDRLDAFDTPVGRLGMLVDYDKTFPETARTLALDGAEILAIPSAWPASRTNRADTLARDRQRRMFDTYDQARAAENQVVVASANQVGRHGALRFFGRSKVVLPDGEIVAVVGDRSGVAEATVDVGAAVGRARRRFHHLGELRPDLYRSRERAEER